MPVSKKKKVTTQKKFLCFGETLSTPCGETHGEKKERDPFKCTSDEHCLSGARHSSSFSSSSFLHRRSARDLLFLPSPPPPHRLGSHIPSSGTEPSSSVCSTFFFLFSLFRQAHHCGAFYSHSIHPFSTMHPLLHSFSIVPRVFVSLLNV